VSARVVTPWVVGAGGSGGDDPGPSGDWRVWVETDGRYELVGAFAGTEAEAIAAAFDATGAARGFALPTASLLSNQTTGRGRNARVRISDRRSP
jgi:hypothetical protein